MNAYTKTFKKTEHDKNTTDGNFVSQKQRLYQSNEIKKSHFMFGTDKEDFSAKDFTKNA